ncbi:MAG: GIY-YIG nuclease family protein [Patescibacteria group bacterium]
MYYVYVLKLWEGTSRKYYIGYTEDLRLRLLQHQHGETQTTRNKNPELIYYEAYQTKYLALEREKNIKKSGSVYMALMKRIRER